MIKVTQQQLTDFVKLLERVSKNSPFYKEKFLKEGIDYRNIHTYEDIKKIPFTTKEEIREAYPLGLMAVDEKEIVRIHSSSGTTGRPVIIPYTRYDVETGAQMMMRCYDLAGVTKQDRVQITFGYGQWTAGIGFQNGTESLGALCIPMGPGNTGKQLQMMVDMQSTVLGATPSYALVLAEEVGERNLREQLNLRTCIIGAERASDKMRGRIEELLGVEIYDMYGLTEIYGPGVSVECKCHEGLHYWDDYLFFEIIDPVTGEVLPEGEMGELVVTTLRKEGAPVIRYRTRDLTRIIPGKCACGSCYPRHDRIYGRTDDMLKIKGINVFPAQIDQVLAQIPGASSEYQIELNSLKGRCYVTLRVECENCYDAETTKESIAKAFLRIVGLKAQVVLVPVGTLPRSEKRTTRVIDNRVK